MTPYYADEWLEIWEGDCREVLASLPADSVDCVVSSPPYWGLRDYGTATWSGGNEACDHSIVGPGRAQRPAGGLTGGKAHVDAGTVKGGDCGRCGATRSDGQLGLERTPEEYVANLVAVFAEVRRVLKPSGTCWLNLGDSYASHDPGGYRQGEFLNPGGREPVKGQARNRAGNYRPAGLKPKDLVGIPWRVAFALQADGWYLRSDIIWAKPNPMPESVTDRPTKAHEYLFLLTRSARYYFDADAVREAHQWHDDRPRMAYNGKGNPEGRALSGDAARLGNNPAGRNIRSVWTIATRPYPGAHFAVFPPELPERCIKAGSSEKGVCPECGAAWERVSEYEHTPKNNGTTARNLAANAAKGITSGQSATRPSEGSVGMATPKRQLGWRPSCNHTAEPVPSVTLDPFAGSGTVGLVANRLSRRAILIDLNPEYLKQQMRRNAQTPLGLAEASA